MAMRSALIVLGLLVVVGIGAHADSANRNLKFACFGQRPTDCPIQIDVRRCMLPMVGENRGMTVVSCPPATVALFLPSRVADGKRP